MRAIVLDEGLRFVTDYPKPDLRPGEALIRVHLAAICATDLELVRGYRPFRGVLGHEFVGSVVGCDNSDWIGQRVVGEINVVCGVCRFCRRGLRSHCEARAAIGISERDGALAEFLSLPVVNLHRVPDGLPDKVAVLTEIVAAALQVLDAVHLRPSDRIAVVGDGRLGLLVAQVLAASNGEVTVFGHHAAKLALAAGWGLATVESRGDLPAGLARQFDLVVDCTGSPAGLVSALELICPRGTVVLKSTYHGLATPDMNRLVVDEVSLVGSRCGPFPAALRLLDSGRIDVGRLVEACYPLDEAGALAAFAHAGRPGALKVLVQP